MHQKPPDKFGVWNRDFTFGITWFYSPCSKSRFYLCDRENSVIGNGNLMGISSQIFDCISETVESFFYERAPVFFIKPVFEIVPLVRITEFFAGR